MAKQWGVILFVAKTHIVSAANVKSNGQLVEFELGSYGEGLWSGSAARTLRSLLRDTTLVSWLFEVVGEGGLSPTLMPHEASKPQFAFSGACRKGLASSHASALY